MTLERALGRNRTRPDRRVWPRCDTWGRRRRRRRHRHPTCPTRLPTWRVRVRTQRRHTERHRAARIRSGAIRMRAQKAWTGTSRPRPRQGPRCAVLCGERGNGQPPRVLAQDGLETLFRQRRCASFPIRSSGFTFPSRLSTSPFASAVSFYILSPPPFLLAPSYRLVNTPIHALTHIEPRLIQRVRAQRQGRRK